MGCLMSLRQLEGFVVGVTADRRWEEQAELLSRRGATVVHGPTISTSYLASDENLRRAQNAPCQGKMGLLLRRLRDVIGGS